MFDVRYYQSQARLNPARSLDQPSSHFPPTILVHVQYALKGPNKPYLPNIKTRSSLFVKHACSKIALLPILCSEFLKWKLIKKNPGKYQLLKCLFSDYSQLCISLMKSNSLGTKHGTNLERRPLNRVTSDVWDAKLISPPPTRNLANGKTMHFQIFQFVDLCKYCHCLTKNV